MTNTKLLKPKSQHTKKAVFTQQSSSVRNIIRPKLQIGAANDKYEQEADRVAERVMRMPEADQEFRLKSAHSVNSIIQRKCSACNTKDEQVQRSTGSPGNFDPGDIGSQINASRGRGNNLDRNTKGFMESRFHRDFSDVRVHSGSTSYKLAQKLNAQAFTVGNDIFFNQGKYNPDTNSGKQLLAHELVHTLQQNNLQNDNENLMLQRSCDHPESFYSTSTDYCRDDSFSPSTHPGKTCYRQIPSRSSYFTCPPGEHVCFDSDGECENSPDRSSLAESKESDGSCNWNGFCVAEHTMVDFVPAVADSMVEPFREIGREARKGLDWRNWYRFFSGPFY